jgi:kynurenine formamidase
VPNGVGLVKLMGRYAGFIAAGATLASQEVNYTLVPEVPFELDGPEGFLAVLEERLEERGHAVIVLAEGAGQHLFEEAESRRDASGNLKLHDIGRYFHQRIAEHFAAREKPAVHLMIATATEGWGADYFALASHGFSTSHIDALCHIFNEGKLYNGYPIERVTAHGALDLGIHHLHLGVVSRGVLLDIPRVRRVDFLEPGEPIFVGDLEGAEAEGSVRVEPGDVVLLRTGRWGARKARGPKPAGEGLAGLDASCLPWLHERGVAALGCDGVSDVLPSRIPDAGLPIHSVAIVAMGLHLIDNLQLDDLADACREEKRIEFHLTIAPLILHQGTASPVNPIALF